MADNNSNVVQMMKNYSFEMTENIVGNGENAGYYQHFLHFPQCFRKAFPSR